MNSKETDVRVAAARTFTHMHETSRQLLRVLVLVGVLMLLTNAAAVLILIAEDKRVTADILKNQRDMKTELLENRKVTQERCVP